MDAEIAVILSHAIEESREEWAGATFYRVRLWGRSLVVVRCGVGKVFAAMFTQRILDRYRPSKVIFTGVAGALASDLEIGDVIISRDLVQHDIDGRALGFNRGHLVYSEHFAFEADPLLRQSALRAELEGPNLREGRILTGDQFLTRMDRESHAFLVDELAGDAVEMEGAALAQVCVLNNIPFIVIRTMSDRADGQAVNDFNAFMPVVAQNSFAVLKAILTEAE
jgi:5'-methylthioadenosine/S-adenosylhomocysteine nucleosidase